MQVTQESGVTVRTTKDNLSYLENKIAGYLGGDNDSVPVSKDALSNMRTLVEIIGGYGLPQPDLYPWYGGDGIQAEWDGEWNRGLVHEVRPHVLHLIRGQVFTIEGERIFVFGGASSHDIGHRILDPKSDPGWKEKWRQLEKDGIWDFRIKSLSWWPQESFVYMDPEDVSKQKEEAYQKLNACGWKIRYVVSHELPSSDVALLGNGYFRPDAHSMFLEEIRQKLDYFRWFGGHYHMDKQITERDAVLYEQIIRIL